MFPSWFSQVQSSVPVRGLPFPQLDKLISERFEIEQKILVVSGEQTEGDDLDGSELEDKETFPES